jgi:peptidyl-prolyl cis-trans isomerase D
MLQDIRDKAQGWIAYAIVFLISVPFALWGIQEYLGVGSEPVVAKVNGNEITERQLDQQFHQVQQNLREQLGAAYKPGLFDDKRMRQEVLKRLVRDDVVLQSSHKMGLRSPDTLVRQTILGIEAFKKDGVFDQATYERAVRLQGLSTAGFEERVRRLLLSQQLSNAIISSAFVTDYELRNQLRLGKQMRKFDYFILPSSDFSSDEPIDEEAILAYYEKHETEFLSPEQVKLEYIQLDAESAGETVEVTEEALQEFYDKHQERYGEPEQRKASHILLTLGQDAEPAMVEETREKLEQLRERVVAGEDFAELAGANSQDPGSAAKGGDLGFFGKGVMVPAFEEAAFNMMEGEVSEPVRSRFGYHLIKLTGISPSKVKPFEAVRQQVEDAYRLAEGERLYFELAESLANLSYEDPTSLQPAADDLQLKIEQSDWLERSGGEGVLRNPKVTAAAFSEDVLVERNNSELIELSQDSALVLRVVDHKEASTLPLDEVKPRITETIKRQRAEEKTRETAENRLSRLEAGEEIGLVADGAEVVQKEDISREDRTLPVMLRDAVFRSGKPQEGKPLHGTVRLSGGDYGLFSLYQVNDGDLEAIDEKERNRQEDELRDGLGQSLFESLVADLESRADIELLLQTTEE